MKNRNGRDKKSILKFSIVIASVILLGAVVIFSIHSLVQESFLQATRTHEMELMQIMETLGSQVMDARLKSLKVDLEGISRQYGEELLSAPEENELRLASIALKEGALQYCCLTKDKQYWSGQPHEERLAALHLTPVWAGETVLFSPDFDTDGTYILPIATPIWQNRQEDTVAGVLIAFLDGYCISRWMEDLFVPLDLGTAYIIDDTGRNIATAREENFDWITSRYNAQELLQEHGDEGTRSIAQLEKRALDAQCGVGTYLWEGSLSYVAYGPLTEAPWGFFIGFYGDQFEAYAREVTQISNRSAGVLLGGFVLFSITILMVIMRNLHKERRYSELLMRQKDEIELQSALIAASEERFRIAMQRSKDIILECQLETGEISCFYENKEVRRGLIGDAGLRNQLVEGYCMDEDSFGRFEEAMRAISGGLTHAEGMISGDGNGVQKWYTMSLAAVPNGVHKPIRAVGILRDVTGEREAELDPLTRLYNKSAMTEYTKSAIQNNLPRNKSAFVMIDIDYFKRINDQYGHPAGDHVLRQIAQGLKTIFPQPYLSGRFGGDEFCIYCPKNVEQQELKKRLEQLLAYVKEIRVKDCAARVASVSIGVVIFHGQAEFEDIYSTADNVLYKAKKAGRDRYCILEME